MASGRGSSTDNLEQQMEGVLALLNRRAKGEVSNDSIEEAVSSILTSIGKKKADNSDSSSVAAKSPPTRELTEDLGNYDDGPDDEGPIEVFSQQNQAGDSKSTLPETLSHGDYEKKLDSIPMGAVGAKMMTAFGDGAQPNAEALRAALKCTRQTMQYAILDARVIRRKAQRDFAKARQETDATGRRRRIEDANSSQQIADPVLLYRALGKHDRLTYQPKCGFDMEQLVWLFPEEMRAYERWNEMHQAFEESRGKADEANAAETLDADPDAAGNNTNSNREEETLGGHLTERAAVFDFRTLEMQKDGYMKFSKVRQGSFLPRGYRQRRSKTESEWEDMTASSQARGKPKSGSWDHMSAAMVRFLHWLGFDPPEVPPPDDETTHALAFLAYDRMGRVIERAILLRNLAMKDTKLSGDPSSVVLRKLKIDEQLSLKDIERAIEDPSIKPETLYGFDSGQQANSRPPNVQLYFGPGFEQRLELEMEEMIASSKKGSLYGEDEKIRSEERALLAKMSANPKDGDSLVHVIRKRKAADALGDPNGKTE